MENKQLERVINLFEFLKQYNVVKNPIISHIDKQEWYYWLDGIPKHGDIQNHMMKEIKVETPILVVRKPIKPELPIPEDAVLECLEKGWDNPEKEAKIKRSFQKKIVEGTLTEEEQEKESAIKQWFEVRQNWINLISQDKSADELFNMFYVLYARLKKEPEAIELLLGDGHLYYGNKGSVNHPILLQAVTLEFDATIPEFRLYVADKMPELYKNIFSFVKEANYDLLIDAYKAFHVDNIQLLDYEKCSAFLKQICYALSPDGQVKEEYSKLDEGGEFPQIYKRPVLLLRKRNLGFGVAIESILEDLHRTGEVPRFLADIVGASPVTKIVVDETEEIDANGIDGKILLTKPSNREQLLVAKHLERNEAVLVQGPPGTGKTHTIANMIGHLLSEGKSILVTSHSEKALSVLKSQVAEKLQPLCLSLLSTTESREEMEKTLEGLHLQRSTLERGEVTKRISHLEGYRESYLKQWGDLKEEFKQLLKNEYTPIEVGEKQYTLTELIETIKSYDQRMKWMPSPVVRSKGLPLTIEELEELYQTNLTVTEEQEILLGCPFSKDWLTPKALKSFLETEDTFKKEQLDQYRIYWQTEKPKCTTGQLQKLVDDIQLAVAYIHSDQEWCLETIEAGKQASAKEKWMNLLASIDEVCELALACSEQMVKYNPQIRELDEKINPKVQFKQIIEKLKSDGKIGKMTTFLNPAMRTLIYACRVNGQVPQTVEEFEALQNYYKLCQQREKLRYRWNRQMASLGAERVEHMGTQFEQTCKKYEGAILQNLNWYEKQWQPILDKLKTYEVDLELLSSYKDLSHHKYSELRSIQEEFASKLTQIIRYQVYKLDQQALEVSKEFVQQAIWEVSDHHKSEKLNQMLKALREDDFENYKEAYEALLDAKGMYGIISRRKELIQQLEGAAPGWAHKVAQREEEHGLGQVPKYVEEAWLYAQFIAEMKYRNERSLAEIHQDLKEVEEGLKNNTLDLAFYKAWLNKMVDFDQDRSQVQAIEGWKQLIIKIGAGKGKQTETLKAEARRLMPKCQSAVPVWIMPLNKVVENFNPKENKFDVVIIDEASQADVMALVALYLGKKVLIVGDNEQVSPLAIGEKAEDVERLVREYLYDIPHYYLYTGKFSIYDLAQVSGYQPVRLKEHFRCVPEIIEYSNQIAYNGQIQPLREGSTVVTKPPIITCEVEEGKEIDGTNPKEAEAIVKQVLTCCEQQEYEGKTFGVITLKGDKQAALIESMLLAQMDPIAYRARNMLCGNPSHFQGDERDIIFISMVDSHDKKGTMRLTSYGIDNLYKKRYNVAMSRARDQVWIFHSFNPEEDLKEGDIRKELLDYCMHPVTKATDKKVFRGLSRFEKKVLNALKEMGYKVMSQWQVGEYNLDLVVFLEHQKVAILCDGEKHKNEEELEEDLEKQSILERVGWQFIRLRASQCFAREEEMLKELSNKLKELEGTTEY